LQLKILSWRARRLARARALAAVLFLDETEHAPDAATEQRLVEGAILQFLRGAAVLDAELTAGRRRARMTMTAKIIRFPQQIV